MFLLPVCTSCCSPKSDDVSTGGSGSGMPENCVVAAYITFISLLFSSRHQRITTSGLRPPYWIYKCMKCTTWLIWVRRKKLRTKIAGISSLAGTEPEILLGVIYPPTCNIRYKNTLVIGGLTITSGFAAGDNVQYHFASLHGTHWLK